MIDNHDRCEWVNVCQEIQRHRLRWCNPCVCLLWKWDTARENLLFHAV